MFKSSCALVFVILFGLEAFGQDSPKAFLRKDNTTYVVDVYTFKPYNSKKGEPIIATLYVDNKKLSSKLVTVQAPPEQGRFQIPVPQTAREVEYNISRDLKYLVAVQSYPDADGDEGWTIPVTFYLSVSLSDSVLAATCKAQRFLPYSFTIVNDSKLPDGVARLGEVVNFLKGKSGVDGKSVIAVKIDPRNANLEEPLEAKVIDLMFFRGGGGGEPAQELVCLKLDRSLPSDSFDIRFDFADPAPLELRSNLLLTDQPGLAKEPASAKLEDSNVGQRKLEKNLDVAGLLSSSVSDEEQPDKSLIRKRKTQGTLDLRFAPWLNLHPNKNVAETVRTPKYFTPFFIDAKVSTGKITKDTLSLNRIILGSEAEIRNYPRSQPSNFYRYVFRASSASDRDFKLAEFKAGFEVVPYFGPLNHPLAARFDVGKNLVDPNPNRGPKVFQHTNGFGWQIQPVVGAEFGRRYRNHLPAEAVAAAFKDVSPIVRRFYFGTNMEFNLTSHATLTLKDRFYIRGEAPSHRKRNYFVASLEAPIGNFGNATGYGVFFSFEKGTEPPFDKPGINVFKIGYRITSNGWFDRVR